MKVLRTNMSHAHRITPSAVSHIVYDGGGGITRNTLHQLNFKNKNFTLFQSYDDNAIILFNNFFFNYK